jgi:hypothetical protein
MLVNCNLHNLRNLEINLKGKNELFALVDCEEFMMIRNPHITFGTNYGDKIHLEKGNDNIKPEDADTKYVADVFKAFPDV